MITAETARLEVRRAQEDYIDNLINKACRIGQDSICVDKKDIPGWLLLKLEENGFKIGVSNTSYTIYWGT